MTGRGEGDEDEGEEDEEEQKEIPNTDLSPKQTDCSLPYCSCIDS